MKLSRRNFLHLAVGAAALPVVSRVASAQAYPSRPVRIIVGFPGGTTGDILIRQMGQWLSDRLGQPFIIENRPGAAGNVATEQVVRATVIRSSWPFRRMQSTRRSTTTSISISSTTSCLSQALPALPLLWRSLHQSRPRPFPSLSPCQGQSGQDQHGLVRHRDLEPRLWRTVHDEGQR